jgi:hypothetical protein
VGLFAFFVTRHVLPKKRRRHFESCRPQPSQAQHPLGAQLNAAAPRCCDATKLFHPKKTNGALFGAPRGVFSFFFTLYIQNSILQRVIGTFSAKLYLPRHQQLASISREIPS